MCHFGWQKWAHYLMLSFANTFGIFGLRREFFASSELIDLPRMLRLLAVGQTVAGSVLLFLLGLALRNRFRMR